MDKISIKDRSELMRKVRSENTRPEMIVRRLVHKLGYRYRLHCSELPGRPDLVFRGRAKVIFVHGCFWHRHSDPNCKLARIPKSRQEYWVPKLLRNRERDIRDQRELKKMEWDYLVIWECELHDLDALTTRVQEFLGNRPSKVFPD